MQRRFRWVPVRHEVGAIALLGASLVCSTIRAGDTSWIEPVSGLLSDPARWSEGVPQPSDLAHFGSVPGGPFTVTVGGVNGFYVWVQNQSVVFSGVGAVEPSLTLGHLNIGGPNEPTVLVERCTLNVTSGWWLIQEVGPGRLVLGEDAWVTANGTVDWGLPEEPFHLELGPRSALTVDGSFTIAGSVTWTIDGRFASLIATDSTTEIRGDISIDFGPEGQPPPGAVLPLATHASCNFEDVTITPPRGELVSGMVGIEDDTLVYRQFDGPIPLVVTSPSLSQPGYDVRVEVTSVVAGEIVPIVRQATLTSSDPRVLAVSGRDTIRGVAPGQAILTASIGASVASVVVTVGDTVNEFVGVDDTLCDSLGPLGLSSDGRFAAFASNDPSLVPNDTNGKTDIFVRDIEKGEVIRVSEGPRGEQGSANSWPAVLSGDGRVVAFRSSSPEIVAGTNVWVVKEILSGAVEVAGPGLGELTNMVLSEDGSMLAFEAGSKAYWRHRPTGETVMVGVSPSGAPYMSSHVRDMTPDGRYVLFRTAFPSQLVMRDVVTGTTTIEATGSGIEDAAVSDDGGIVAYTVGSPGLQASLVVRDRVAGESTTVATWQWNDQPLVSISGDGRFVVVHVQPERCPGEPMVNEPHDGLMRYDRLTGTMQGVATRRGEVATGFPFASARTMQSADGRYCLFMATREAALPGVDPCQWTLRRRFGPEFGADINHDGVVTATDLALLLGAWGSDNADADLDGNGVVESMDVAVLLAGWSG
jgi:Tol biopolymer transport system component